MICNFTFIEPCPAIPGDQFESVCQFRLAKDFPGGESFSLRIKKIGTGSIAQHPITGSGGVEHSMGTLGHGEAFASETYRRCEHLFSGKGSPAIECMEHSVNRPGNSSGQMASQGGFLFSLIMGFGVHRFRCCLRSNLSEVERNGIHLGFFPAH